jgi:hypothetical protein
MKRRILQYTPSGYFPKKNNLPVVQILQIADNTRNRVLSMASPYNLVFNPFYSISLLQ